jgi:2'-5' RNA ligase
MVIGTYMRTSIYMIAILPPEPIYSEVQEFKKRFVDAYESNEAYRRPAHITVIPPFEYSQDEEQKLTNFLTKFLKKYSPFELSFDGFGIFEKRVIFVQPEKNEPLKILFQDIKKAFNKEFKVREGSSSSLPYAPHMTIGYKDLKPAMYDLAWQEFCSKIYRRKFMLGGLYLMRHTGQKWIAVSEVPLSYNPEDELTLGF